MTTEWTDLPTLVSVCNAQTDGWEIEVNTGPHWEEWKGSAWMNYMEVRARPRQPKMKKVKMLCYYNGGSLLWVNEDTYMHSRCIYIPAQDIEIEIPEGV